MLGDEIGYAWLAAHYDVQATQSLPVESRIGRRRHTYDQDGRRQENYPEPMRPDNTLAAHLTFALKHEGVALEFLVRLFEKLPGETLAEWIRSEPTGQYARRAGFLYEWLTGKILAVEHVGGNYRDALNPDLFVTSTTPKRNRRWRINDNLPGTPAFCPLIRRTSELQAARQYDIAQRLDMMEAEFGTDIMRRSAVWLTIKESRASFVIEHEGQHQDRIQRFATAMEQYCGRLSDPLDEHALAELQAAILGTTTIRTGLRRSPVFIGSRSVDYGAEVHYICPHWQWLPGMLVNDVLRRDGAVPKPFILPISAAITSSAVRRAEYDRILERYSRPFMMTYRPSVEFTRDRKVYADGIESDLFFDSYAEAVENSPDR